MLRSSRARRGILGGALLTLVILALLPILLDRSGPPNILLIVLDTVRADAVGGRPGPESPTPSLDELAAEGARFTHIYAPAPWTVPSHASIFTGLQPHQHGATHARRELPPGPTTLAELLRDQGYDTAGFTCNPWLHRRSGMARGFDEYVEVYKLRKGEPDKGARKATRLALQWLRRREQAKRPFLLFINYLDAHLPYEPPEEALARLGPGGPAASMKSFSVEQADLFLGGELELSPEELESVRRLYTAEVSYLDARVAELVAHLRSTGELDETMVIVTSDHGEFLGEHGLSGHEFALFDPVLRVPLIVRYPEAFPAGTEAREPAGLIDILPTVIDTLDLEDALPTLPGRSLRSPAADERSAQRPMLAEYQRPKQLIGMRWRSKYPQIDLSRFDTPLRSVRRGDLKYIVAGDGREWLYDLAEDPGEERNLAPGRPELLPEMRALLEEMSGKR